MDAARSSTIKLETTMHHTYSLSVGDAARAIGIGKTKLRELINSGALPVVKIGRRTLIKTASIEALLQHDEVA
jgi:excisionase family DNA binding protein